MNTMTMLLIWSQVCAECWQLTWNPELYWKS